MAPGTSSMRTSIVLLLLCTAPLMATAWPPWRDHKSVNIISEVDEPPLSVHCKSGDNDLGVHTLKHPHRTYGFGFYPNFGGTTEFWCSFQWGSRYQRFTVWKDIGPFPGDDSHTRRCEQCVYVVRPDVFLRSEGPDGPFTPVALWKH